MCPFGTGGRGEKREKTAGRGRKQRGRRGEGGLRVIHDGEGAIYVEKTLMQKYGDAFLSAGKEKEGRKEGRKEKRSVACFARGFRSGRWL